VADPSNAREQRTPTLDQLVQEMEKEIFQTGPVFDRLVAERRMNRGSAEFRIRCKKEIMAILRRLRDAEAAAAAAVQQEAA
jgi:hypothetical protein